jgi:hypothetical protein
MIKVEEAKGVCKDRSKEKEIISVYLKFAKVANNFYQSLKVNPEKIYLE